MLIIENESEMTIMGRKWNNIKEKRLKKIKIQVEYMPNSVKKYMWQLNQVKPILNLTKPYV